jgi:hypothetical protein
VVAPSKQFAGLIDVNRADCLLLSSQLCTLCFDCCPASPKFEVSFGYYRQLHASVTGSTNCKLTDHCHKANNSLLIRDLRHLQGSQLRVKPFPPKKEAP